jgi:hypothetical protein
MADAAMADAARPPVDVARPPPDAPISMADGTVGDECLQCVAHNPDPDCAPRYSECVSLPGTAAAGPAVGQPKSALCLALLTCVHVARCDRGSALRDCFCGPGVDPIACRTTAAGACRSAFYAAGESTDNVKILERLIDPSFAEGVAGLIVTRCEHQPPPRCGSACGH